MTGRIHSRLPAGLAARIGVLAPDWVRAMFLGQPMARRVRFAAEGQTPKRGQLPVEALTADPQDIKPKRPRRTVDALVPQSLFLARRISAPRTGKARLEQMAALDLRQRTPFGPEDVHWLLDRPSQAGNSTEARQWVVKRSDVQDWARRLKTRGLRLRRVYVEGADTAVPIADFSGTLAPRAGRVRLLNGALALVTVGALAAGWLMPGWVAMDQTAALQRDLSTLRAEAVRLREEVEALRARDGERAAFLNSVLRRPLLVDTLRELTVALPDDVWVETLVFGPERAVITGEAGGSAADTVLGLGKRAALGNPRLSGPVSRTAANAERFEITVDLGAGS